MAERRPPYAPEYRRQMVELVRAGRTPGELAREFECSAQAVRNWVRQADRDEGRREDGLTSAEREELRRLRRENRQLREEREIPKKAAAWFARETGTVPGRSQTFKDRPPGPPDQGDSIVTGAVQSGGRSAVGRRILARPLLSISIRYRLGVWDMTVGKDL